MDLVGLLGLAGSLSLLAGWRLYLCAFATGLAMRFGWIDLPAHLEPLGALANPWVLGIAFAGLVAELLADKIAWLDSAWDAVHTFIRPLGGALLALAVVDADDPAWQVATFLLGGGAAFLSHGAKTGARALVNVSPEPASNVVVSTGEDAATLGLLGVALANPVGAVIVALVVLVFGVALLVYVRRALKAARAWRDRLFPTVRHDDGPPATR